MKSEWADVNINEVFVTIAASAGIGFMRMLYLIRKGRNKFVWFDLVLEPCLAVFAGMLVWGGAELAGLPGILKSILASLGSWGGPKTIHWAERKYLGGSRETDKATSPMPLE